MKNLFPGFLAALILLFPAASLRGQSRFWGEGKERNPRELKPPRVEPIPEEIFTPVPTPTPRLLPKVEFAELTPTPTPRPGVSPKSPSRAAVMSMVLPGSGHAYVGEPLKGLLFAGVFGVSVWQSLENFELVNAADGEVESRNETAGSLYGLAALAAYGFGIQDAYNGAKRYNRRHHFQVTFLPRSRLLLQYRF